MAELYMLDTNTVSYLIKGKLPAVKKKLQQVSMNSVCISAITEAELLRGVLKKPEATMLSKLVNAFLLRVDVLPWDSEAAAAYARLRTLCEKEGKSLGNMDMLIASHAVAINATLVSNDKAFYRVEHHIRLEDWA
jgi:tRNA(fMet)-specific endonuclease VapC